MKASVKRWMAYLGYPLGYLALLGLFGRLTFPYERVRDRLVAEFNAKQASSGMRLEVAEMRGHWLSGIAAEGITLTRTSVGTDASSDSADEQKPKVTTIDEMYGSVSLLRLVFGRVAGSFGATMKGGTVEGSFSSSDAEQTLELELERVEVGDIPMLSDLAGLPLKGTVDGTVEVTLPDKQPAKAEGKLELNLENLAAGDGKAKILKAIALPELKVGNVKLSASITEGRVKVENMSAKGPDFEMSVDGSLRLRDPMPQSILDLGMRFRFMDSYKNKNDITKGLFGANGVPGLFEMDEKVRRSKREDGFYGWRVVGSLSKPIFEPNPTGAVGNARTPARTGAKRGAKVPAIPTPGAPAQD